MRKNRLRSPLLHLVLMAHALFVLLPVFWMAFTSLKDRTESFSLDPPARLSLDNYAILLKEYSILDYFSNSLAVAFLSTLFVVIFAVLAVYGFTKFPFKHSGKVLAAILFLRMIPFITIIIPLYLMMVEWGLVNTKSGLVLGNTVFNLPVAVWLLIPFFKSFPDELLESSFIDGSSRLRSLVQIVLPLSLPAIMVILIFTFISVWNEFMFSMIMVSDKQSQVLTVAIAGLTSKYGVRWDLMTPAAVMYIVPVISLTILFQKQIIGGMTAGALKG